MIRSYESQNLIDLSNFRSQLIGASPVSNDGKKGGEIGIDYIPPLNAGLLVTIPVAKEIAKPPTGSLLKGQYTETVPDSFSWNSIADIRKYKGWKIPDNFSFVEHPPNQGGCGACWAINSAAVLGDRFAIWKNEQNRRLSGTFIIACNTEENTGLCRGGTTGEAGKFFEQQGIPSFDCWDYSWCSNDPGCIKGTTVPSILNTLVPKCDLGICMHSCEKSECEHSGNVSYFKAQTGSTKSLSDPDMIKAEVFHKGPVVVTYRVFGDFLAGGLHTPSWAKTNGIYVHIPSHDLYEYGSISCVGTQKPAFQCYIGNHAVSIVGWGKETIPNFLHSSSSLSPSIELKYWVVRNSWGEKWNGDGYFKIAVSNPVNGINTEVAMDRVVKIGGQLFGGGTAFDPDIEWVRRDGSIPIVDRGNKHSNRASTFVLVIGGIILIVAFVVVGIKLEKKYSK